MQWWQRQQEPTVLLLAASLVFACPAPPVRSAPQTDQPNAWVVPTFECLGLYCDGQNEEGECRVRYCRSGAQAWREGLPLVYGPRDHQYRGSLVGLAAGTQYEFTITDPMVRQPNPALDAGVPIPGFNDDYQGTAPDIGAFENGNPPLRFGREAAPGFAPAPWEVYPTGKGPRKK